MTRIFWFALQVDDAVHDQTFFLTQKHKEQLKEEYGERRAQPFAPVLVRIRRSPT